ncbi:unnamed protein product [Rodentolepis nana]|uniref:Uncharacterized protein n=1 Tax=Rodentolepis nana TaxID=102285 RepID=A0A3P7S0Y1_RODNA|nr:unnamed protein product [Rodentolepis nana]
MWQIASSNLSKRHPPLISSKVSKYPYLDVHHQLEWITEYSKNESDLSLGKPVKIFYDRRLLYHVTESEGCRFKCVYTKDVEELEAGDIAVFSASFSSASGEELKRRGVWVAFESAESPVHMRQLNETQAILVDMFITYMPWSELPFMYPMFIRNVNPHYSFTREEVDKMLTRNNTHLLPTNHCGRTKLVTWMVSNLNPKNDRKKFAELLQLFVPMS